MIDGAWPKTIYPNSIEKVGERYEGYGVCHNCYQVGHFNADCPKPRKFQTGVICRNCKETGHYSESCAKPKVVPNIKCYNCNNIGHYRNKCPQAQN